MYKVWLDCEADPDLLAHAFEQGLDGKEFPDAVTAENYSDYTDMDYVESINKIARDIHDKGLQVFIDDALVECKKETLTEDVDLRIQYPNGGVKVEVQSDDAEDLVDFARAILGDNYDCFDCDFADVMLSPDADVVEAPAPVFMGIDLAEPIKSDEPYVDPFEQDIFTDEQEVATPVEEVPAAEETPVVNEMPEFAEPEISEPVEDQVVDPSIEEPAVESETEVEVEETVPQEEVVDGPVELAEPVEDPVVPETSEAAETDDGSEEEVEPSEDPVTKSDEEVIEDLEEALASLDDFDTQVHSDEMIPDGTELRSYACLVDDQVVGYVEAENEEEAYAEMERQYPDCPYNHSDGYCRVELAENIEDNMSDEEFVEAVGKMIVDNRKNK